MILYGKRVILKMNCCPAAVAKNTSIRQMGRRRNAEKMHNKVFMRLMICWRSLFLAMYYSKALGPSNLLFLARALMIESKCWKWLSALQHEWALIFARHLLYCVIGKVFPWPKNWTNTEGPLRTHLKLLLAGKGNFLSEEKLFLQPYTCSVCVPWRIIQLDNFLGQFSKVTPISLSATLKYG